MKAAEALIAYTPNREAFKDDPSRGEIEVGGYVGDGPDWTSKYRYTTGACYARVHHAVGWEAVALLFIDFHTITVRDRLDPQVVHDAFCAIDEWRHRIAPDVRGAEEPDGSKPDFLSGQFG